MHNWRLQLFALLAVLYPIATHSERNLVDGWDSCCDREFRGTRLDGSYRFKTPEDRRLSLKDHHERYEVRKESVLNSERRFLENSGRDISRYSPADRLIKPGFREVRVAETQGRQQRDLAARGRNRDIDRTRSFRQADVHDETDKNRESTFKPRSNNRNLLLSNGEQRLRMSSESRRDTLRFRQSSASRVDNIREARDLLQRARDDVTRRDLSRSDSRKVNRVRMNDRRDFSNSRMQTRLSNEDRTLQTVHNRARSISYDRRDVTVRSEPRSQSRFSHISERVSVTREDSREYPSIRENNRRMSNDLRRTHRHEPEFRRNGDERRIILSRERRSLDVERLDRSRTSSLDRKRRSERASREERRLQESRLVRDRDHRSLDRTDRRVSRDSESRVPTIRMVERRSVQRSDRRIVRESEFERREMNRKMERRSVERSDRRVARDSDFDRRERSDRFRSDTRVVRHDSEERATRNMERRSLELRDRRMTRDVNSERERSARTLERQSRDRSETRNVRANEERRDRTSRSMERVPLDRRDYRIVSDRREQIARSESRNQDRRLLVRSLDRETNARTNQDSTERISRDYRNDPERRDFRNNRVLRDNTRRSVSETRMVSRKTHDESRVSERRESRDIHERRQERSLSRDRAVSLERRNTRDNMERDSRFRVNSELARREILMSAREKTYSEEQGDVTYWPYLFYTLQGAYLCGVLMQILSENTSKKQRTFSWWNGPQHIIKLD